MYLIRHYRCTHNLNLFQDMHTLQLGKDLIICWRLKEKTVMCCIFFLTYGLHSTKCMWKGLLFCMLFHKTLQKTSHNSEFNILQPPLWFCSTLLNAIWKILCRVAHMQNENCKMIFLCVTTLHYHICMHKFHYASERITQDTNQYLYI